MNSGVTTGYGSFEASQGSLPHQIGDMPPQNINGMDEIGVDDAMDNLYPALIQCFAVILCG